MTSRLVATYHRLPPPLQGIVASLRGLQLHRWRYGPGTDRLVEEALERERWSEGAWTAWQEERLARLLERAATRVPFYRDHWAARRREGDRSSWELLSNWPILPKEAVRQAPHAFVADDCDVRTMFEEHTSGTTGTSLRLWWSRDTVRAWYALFEARWRRWYGVSRHDRWAIVGGQQVVAPARRRAPYWVHNRGLRQLYLSSYHIGPATARTYLEAMARHRPRYAYGYPSALQALAEAGGRYPGSELAVVLTNGEPLSPTARHRIGDTFGCPVRETYGMAEIVAAASECDAGRLHLWPEAGLDELPDGPGAPAGLVSTGLMNADMPLIRYATGDRALRAGGGPCTCGRTLPVLAALEGREDDVLVTPDGRRVGRLDPVFKADLRVREAQVRQERLDRIRVLVVPGRGYDTSDAARIADGLRERLGAVEVVIEPVEVIPRDAAGKFRAVVALPAGTAADGEPA